MKLIKVQGDTEMYAIIETRAKFDEMEKQYGADTIIAFKQLLLSAKYCDAVNVPDLVKHINEIVLVRADKVLYAQLHNDDVITAYEQSEKIKIFKYSLFLNDNTWKNV